jgi:hypothetical protein
VEAIWLRLLRGAGGQCKLETAGGQLESAGGFGKRRERVLDEPGAGRTPQAHNRM